MRGKIDPEAFKEIEGTGRYMCKCNRCGKIWISLTTRVPVACSGCSSPYWKYLRILEQNKGLKPESDNN